MEVVHNQEAGDDVSCFVSNISSDQTLIKCDPDLLADEVEGVDIRSSTQQTLIEDNSKHQPGTRQEQVPHCE